MNDYQEVVINGGDGTTVRGRWWTHDEMITVTSSYGQEKTTQLGGSTPYGLARLMLLEMEEDRRGHPVPPTPEEIEEAERNANRLIDENRFNRMADHAARGRRFSGLSYAELLKSWIAAYDQLEDDDDLPQWALVTDLNAEFEIRGIEPPYQEYSQRRWAERGKNQRVRIPNKVMRKRSSADKTKR
jgi:hypothetical protein